MNVLVATCTLQKKHSEALSIYLYFHCHEKYTESNSVVVKLLPGSLNPVDSLLFACGLKVCFLCGCDMLLWGCEQNMPFCSSNF